VTTKNQLHAQFLNFDPVFTHEPDALNSGCLASQPRFEQHHIQYSGKYPGTLLAFGFTSFAFTDWYDLTQGGRYAATWR